MTLTPLPWVYDDGGRAAAGRSGTTGDCVVRAIAIASGIPYADVYTALGNSMKARMHDRIKRGRPHKAYASPRDGVPMDVAKDYHPIPGEDRP